VRHHPQQPTTIAIVGADALAEDILAQLLQEEGYTTRVHEVHPIGLTEELLDGVDVVLLAPENLTPRCTGPSWAP
jgi:hypothetical protein